MPAVLVAGSLHYDILVRAPRLPALDETLPGSAVRYACGGKGGNQAVATAAHGAPTAFAGRVGDDEAGRALLANLDRADVDRSRVVVSPQGSSGMSVAIETPAGDYGAVIVSAANLAIDLGGFDFPETTKLLILQNEIPDAANLAFAAMAKAAGATVILNAAPARPFATSLIDLVDILVVNRVEAVMMSGRTVASPSDAARAAEALRGNRRSVIVTLGEEGAVLAEPDREPRSFPALAADVVSSHGAGDAFVGALAARLALGDKLEAALRYAQAAASLHVSSRNRDAITPAMVWTRIGTEPDGP